MRLFRIFIVVVSLGFAAMVTQAFIVIWDNDSPRPEADKGFAVVELFTSEGCSSCPPADALLARVQKESAGKPIYILAYHVDYWNRLGWKDVFSDAAYSARQQQYARWLKSSEIYTPQAIVNGRAEFVGSNESALRNDISSAIQKVAKTELTISGVKAVNDKATLQYYIEASTGNSNLMVALIEKNATTKVERGENGGRTLPHVQIVRKLESVALSAHNSGTVNIALPAGFSPDTWEVIAFVQNTGNGEISGAAKAGFTPTLGK